MNINLGQDVFWEMAWWKCECGWWSNDEPEWAHKRRRVDVDHFVDQDETYPACGNCLKQAKEK